MKVEGWRPAGTASRLTGARHIRELIRSTVFNFPSSARAFSFPEYGFPIIIFQRL